MRRVIYFYDRCTGEVYRKCTVFFGSDAYNALMDICSGEIGDGWDDVTEEEYEALVQSGELIEDEVEITSYVF